MEQKRPVEKDPKPRKDDLIVIGGGGGFIGGSLARYFTKKGFTRIRAVDKKPLPEWYQRVPGVECLTMDLSQEDNCIRACEGAAEVYNLAADMGGMGFIERFRVECLRSVLINTHMIEAAYRAGAICSFDHVRINQNAAQAFDAKSFDETHAAHICREVIDFGGSFTGADAIILLAEIHRQTLHAGNALIPFGQRLFVHGTYAREAFLCEIAGQGAANEAPAAANDYQIIFPRFWIFFYRSFLFHKFSGLVRVLRESGGR